MRKKEEKGEKRKREEEKEESDTGTGKKRCEDFVSVEAFDIFGQGGRYGELRRCFLGRPLGGA